MGSPLIIKALESLRSRDEIACYFAIPPDVPAALITKQGLSHWAISDLRTDRIRSIRRWDLIYLKPVDSKAVGNFLRSRVVIFLEVVLGSESVIVMEVEARSNEGEYALIAWKSDSPLSFAKVKNVFWLLRKRRGVLEAESCAEAFRNVTENPIRRIERRYTVNGYGQRELCTRHLLNELRQTCI